MSQTTRHPSNARSLFRQRTFILLVTYTAPLPRIDELLDEHRRWLDEHFADGTFLVSGPQVPRTGGTIIATARSRGQIEQLLPSDPLVRGGLAAYQIVEFKPTRGPYAPSDRIRHRPSPTAPPAEDALLREPSADLTPCRNPCQSDSSFGTTGQETER